MEVTELESIIESILFASGDSVSLEKLADIIECEKELVKEAVETLAEKYDYYKRGFKILRLEESYQMATREDYAEYVQRLTEPRVRRPLSVSAMEVLAVISYKQPVTRQQIEQIRGVNCDYAVTRLLEKGLIEEKGRLDVPGRPVLFGTTEEFLRCFGISSLKDLPELEGLQLEPFRDKGAVAYQQTLDV